MTNLAVLLLAAAACAYALIHIVRALGARRWPVTEGTIAGTRLVHRSDPEDGTSDYEYLAYRYEVAGQHYRNDRVRFGYQVTPNSVVPSLDPEPRSPDAAAALAARYPKGMPVRVHYNPRDPSDSVLHPAPNLSVWLALVVGLLFGAAALQGKF